MDYTKYGIEKTHRTWAQISLKNLAHNARVAREKASDSKLMCVIKADAYGHGAVACGLYLQREHLADAFAVACLEEAIELREGGITLPILVLGFTDPGYAKLLSLFDITQSVVDEPMAVALSNAAVAPIKVHAQIDTGMSRTGLFSQNDESVNDSIEAVVRVSRLKNLEVTGMFTHLSVADTDSEDYYTNWQIDNFIKVRDGLKERGMHIAACHASNSAAILRHSRAHFDMVREGIMLYGLYPDSKPVQNGLLKPVMTLKSRVGQVRELQSGTSVSYGRTYTATKDIRSAVILIGYADGYPRRLSNHATITINGRNYPQIGRVCMDMIMADVTEGREIKRGDIATLFGDGAMSIEHVSEIIGTINYEITSLITRRANRIYVE